MRTSARPTQGDGHTATSTLEPARCSCGAHLVLACEQGCGETNPELGIMGPRDPIARLRAPRSDLGRRHRTTRASAPQKMNICARCRGAFPTTSGRQPKVGPCCVTAQELALRAAKQKLNAKYIVRRAAG